MLSQKSLLHVKKIFQSHFDMGDCFLWFQLTKQKASKEVEKDFRKKEEEIGSFRQVIHISYSMHLNCMYFSTFISLLMCHFFILLLNVSMSRNFFLLTIKSKKSYQ